MQNPLENMRNGMKFGGEHFPKWRKAIRQNQVIRFLVFGLCGTSKRSKWACTDRVYTERLECCFFEILQTVWRLRMGTVCGGAVWETRGIRTVGKGGTEGEEAGEGRNGFVARHMARLDRVNKLKLNQISKVYGCSEKWGIDGGKGSIN